MDEGKLREDPALVMECALDMGETMLRCGAEILRVEDTITRICTAYGGGIVDVYHPVPDYPKLEDGRGEELYAREAD